MACVFVFGEECTHSEVLRGNENRAEKPKRRMGTAPNTVNTNEHNAIKKGEGSSTRRKRQEKRGGGGYGLRMGKPKQKCGDSWKCTVPFLASV